jgi:hypothetical protein
MGPLRRRTPVWTPAGVGVRLRRVRRDAATDLSVHRVPFTASGVAFAGTPRKSPRRDSLAVTPATFWQRSSRLVAGRFVEISGRVSAGSSGDPRGACCRCFVHPTGPPSQKGGGWGLLGRGRSYRSVRRYEYLTLVTEARPTCGVCWKAPRTRWGYGGFDCELSEARDG